MLKIYIQDKNVLLRYEPWTEDTNWINKKFEKGDELNIKKVFTLHEEDLFELRNSENSWQKTFKIGEKKGDYYVISNKVLNLKHEVLIHFSVELSPKLFIYEGQSIFLKIEELSRQQVVINGDKPNAIPIEAFREIIESFPTKREYEYYVDSRLAGVISNYLDGVKDSNSAFERYLKKRRKIISVDTISSVKEYEKIKYEFILKVLKDMLKNSQNYTETDWQNKILEIILILYPKYIRAFTSAPVKDHYTDPIKPKERKIDIMLVAANGSIDLIEIKKPFPNCIVTKNPSYRDNHIPLRDLSGAIMQIEKYIFHLSKCGVNGEKVLNTKYKKELPPNVEINVTTPKGIIVMGRSDNLTSRQLFDFEIIKRKYSSIVDVITYDDLIQRLENILSKF